MSDKCICVRTCDCQNPELTPGGGAVLVSHECPEHNENQRPNPDCQAATHWFELQQGPSDVSDCYKYVRMP